VRKRHFFWRSAQIIALLGAGSLVASAQITETRGLDSLALPSQGANANGANYKELHCGGYIRQSQLPSFGQIVGGEQEQEQYSFGQGDYIYLNVGADKGVRTGQEFEVIRPRGTVKSKFSRKGALGVFVQELGQIRVVAVKEKTSVAVVTTSCETMLLGDLITDVPSRNVNVAASPANFDRFAEPSGKATGRIVLARDGQEMLSRQQVVYIDLGAEDNLRVGDRLTIYRPVGKGGVVNPREVEVARGATGDFGSRVFKGGKFSNQAQRSKESGSGVYNGRTVNTGDIKDARPAMPRKIVGEMVVLNVQERTATALITVTAQEVHTGDWVEIK
jgi:hypothetical protein